MTIKLALALALSVAFATPALAAQKGLPETVRCTHCLPSVQTGGAPVVSKGRVVSGTAEAAPVGTAVRRPAPVAQKYSPAAAEANGTAAVAAACGCASGACPTHG